MSSYLFCQISQSKRKQHLWQPSQRLSGQEVPFPLATAHLVLLSHSLENPLFGRKAIAKLFRTERRFSERFSEQALTLRAQNSNTEPIIQPEITMDYSIHCGWLFSSFWCSFYLSPDFLKRTESPLPQPVFSVHFLSSTACPESPVLFLLV